MRTAWGELPVHDAHVHFFSHRFFTQLAREKQGLTWESMEQALGWEMPPKEPESLAARWVEELDRYGVDRAVLIASLPGDEASVHAAVTRYPERFYGYFFLNPLMSGAAARAEQALASGLHGICLFPAMHHYSLLDESIQPIFETAAQSPGTVVFTHCGVLKVGVRQKLGLPSRFDMRFSNPIDLQSIAARYPSVNFVIPHFGAGYFREALMVCDMCPNIYLDTSSSNEWMRYQPGRVDLREVLKHAVELLGPERLLFGSDSSFFPRGWNQQIFETQANLLAVLGVEEAGARAILGGNLERLLGKGESALRRFAHGVH